MNRCTGILILLTLLAPAVGIGTATPSSVPAETDPVRNSLATDVAQTFFVENRGQVIGPYGNVRPEILYVADVGMATIYVRKRGITYQLRKLKAAPNAQNAGKDIPVWIRDHNYDMIRVDLDFLDCRASPEVYPRDPRPDVSNYYLPHCPDGIHDVKSYETVLIKNLYPKIDLRLRIKDGSFKSEFIVHPGAQPENIRFAYKGAERCSVVGNGNLRVDAVIATIEESAPKAWESDGKNVPVAFRVDSLVASFSIGAYDRRKKLVIDPWGRFFGAAVDDYLLAAGSDAAGNIYATGMTYRTDLLGIPGKPITVHTDQDIVLTKYGKDGTPRWTTMYGGNMHDRVMNLCVDGAGNPVIAGSAESMDLPLRNAFQRQRGAGWDFFLAKFSPKGALTWGTYFGGNNLDGPLFNAEWRCGLDTGPENDVVFCSGTQSTDLPTQNGHQPKFGGGFEIILARFAEDGDLVWASYFGGPHLDAGRSCIVTPQNTIVVGGVSAGGLPLRAPLQDTHGGGEGDWPKDAVLAEFDLSGRLIWSSYFGGEGTDDQPGLTADDSGRLYMYMPTTSRDLPVLRAVQKENAGGYDGYLCRFSALDEKSGKRQVESATYYGGSGDERTQGACPVVDSNNRILIVGCTNSDDYPLVDPFQAKRAGGYDIFASMFTSELQPEYSTYIGGRAEDQGFGATVDPFDNVVLVGGSASNDFPLISRGRHSPAGDRDGFLLHIGPNGPVLSPPRTPSGFRGETLSPSRVFLQWDDVRSFASAFVLEGRRNGGAWQEIQRVSGDRHGDTLRGLTPGSKYDFRIKAVNARHASAYAHGVDLTLPAMPVPGDLRAEDRSITSITLRWVDTSAYHVGYVLECSPDSRNWRVLDTAGTDVRNYRLQNRPPATTWHFRIRSLEGSTVSAYSEIVTASTLPFSAPSALAASAITHEGMHLRWEDNSTGEHGFIIEIRTPGGVWTQIANVDEDVSAYTIEGLLSSTTYECRVRGVTPEYESPSSNVVRARTLFFLEAPMNMLISIVLAAMLLGGIVYWRMLDRRRQSELRAQAAEYKEGAARSEALRMQAEHERKEREAQRQFTRRVLEYQETERKRIATELHDGVGQDILVIKNRALLGLQSGEAAQKQLEGISEDASLVLEEMRRISRELRPVQLDRFGLTAALEGMIEHMEDVSGLDIEMNLDDTDGKLTPEMEMNLFRIVQEGFNNVLKHSAAKTVRLSLSQQSDTVILTLTDDGIGFDLALMDDLGNRNAGMGLRGMQERSDILGGRLHLESAPGKGTRISVTVPLATDTGQQGDISEEMT